MSFNPFQKTDTPFRKNNVGISGKIYKYLFCGWLGRYAHAVRDRSRRDAWRLHPTPKTRLNTKAIMRYYYKATTITNLRETKEHWPTYFAF